jgi:uroporphyrin-III C-methyltransferase/precorrin-2 dehydrogenase/sirohydrochlorin ferrochelatase
MDHLPVFMDVRNKKVVVLGGGLSAARRTELALRAGAHVTVFADALSAEFHGLQERPHFTHVAGFPALSDLEASSLVFGADESLERNKALYELAHQARTPVNVADVLELCDFITPAIIDRSPVVAAVSSSGASPLLARTIKAQLESVIPAAFGALSEFLRGFRELAAQHISNARQRRRFWEEVIAGPIAERVMAGDLSTAERMLKERLAEQDAAGGGARMGEVYLVGAGPGDPDLLTFRALRLMQRADVVLHDRLLGPNIVNLVRREAERIYVGKRSGDHAVPQEEIGRTLVRLAREGKRVLRLKGGDPFIFGRGGEEIEELAREGIPFEIVPGVTAATGCAAYAGVPLTHRDYAQSCVFVTGHLKKNGELDLNWDALTAPNQTVAVYMGLAALPEITRQLMAHGAAPELPVAVVDNGARSNQRVVVGVLRDIAAKVAGADLKGPAMTIVGEVVRLREKLAWYRPEAADASGQPLSAGASAASG